MKYVEFYKLNNDGSQTMIAVCSLNGEGLVECEGNENLVENLKAEGIKNYADESGDSRLFFKDGLKFLEQLKFNFKSGYLNASDVLEK
mgnify:CR=1 FL=1